MGEVEKGGAFDIAWFVEHHQGFVTVVFHFEIIGAEVRTLSSP